MYCKYQPFSFCKILVHGRSWTVQKLNQRSSFFFVFFFLLILSPCLSLTHSLFFYLAPAAAPENIVIHWLSDSSMSVRWLPPPRPYRYGDINGYVVSIVFLYGNFFTVSFDQYRSAS